MNCHQILTGAVNAGNHCFAVGSVEGIPFTAYAAGCDIVILACSFERVQIIPGVCHGNIQVACLDCSTDTGKIAAAYGHQICIFEPTPLAQRNSSHKLNYRWVQTATFQADCYIENLSWNLEGTRLLTGGKCIQMWNYNNPSEDTILEEDEFADKVQFQVGGEESVPIEPYWSCIWSCKTAHPVCYLKFSPDGTLFASAGKTDRLVKIWYESKSVNFPGKSLESQCSTVNMDDVSFTFIYIAHPRAVTGLSWRKTSKYMPRGAVANMLVTSCRDNICRVWVQTVLPDDGLVNMQQFDPMAAQNPKFRTHRHKHKFMMRLKHMKTCFQFRRRQATHHQQHGNANAPIPTLPSTFSAHDFHSFGVHGTGMTPGFHFHLAASINAETDIPLVPSISGSGDLREPNFVLHWLNNKEMHFTLQAEQILQELSKKTIEIEQVVQAPSDEEVEDEAKEEEEVSSNGKKSKPIGLMKPKPTKLGRGKSQDEIDDPNHITTSSYSLASAVSSTSLTADSSATATAGLVLFSLNILRFVTQSPLGDALDRKIESLLRDWHGSPDLLFSIHPVDGSFLVWLIEWLDEYIPSSFRQAQVSFSTRIPNALPLGDAMTMSTNLIMYNCRGTMDVKTESTTTKPQTKDSLGSTSGCSTICMVSKHKNGSLNLWNVTFNDNTKFTQLLSVCHALRVCGHRFRVNDITCHPVLPLLLTTSHHNLPSTNDVRSPDVKPDAYDVLQDSTTYSNDEETPLGFCSELILWRVDPVGPLCRSGGVTELARINSPEISAFSNVAWIPTLLPRIITIFDERCLIPKLGSLSTTLGSLSNSPSACFVASDGKSLRIYQAVIDARTLLAEIFNAERKILRTESMMSMSSSSSMGLKQQTLHSTFKIVSQQSTSRPGCVIQLAAIADAVHDWQNTQLLHVFQEQLITGERNDVLSNNIMDAGLGAMVDLQQSSIFEEPFYLVVIEKDQSGGSTLHMWRIVIASQPITGGDKSNKKTRYYQFINNSLPTGLLKNMTYAPDSNLVQDSDADHSNLSSRSNTPEPSASQHNALSPPLTISTTKICTQKLILPPNVEIIHATPAAGHLSSSSIYPACFAPYLLTTACSDSKVRFWYCNHTEAADGTLSYEWIEWKMLNTKEESSCIEILGLPLNVSCAYSGRIACAYKSGQSFTRPTSDNPNSRFVNLCVAIYECESTGGSEWILEDTIQLKNISLPEIKMDLDLSFLQDKSLLEKKKKQSLDNLSLIAVPSFSTLYTLRKAIAEQGNQCILTQKHLVQLDWVSTEDGSHVLTVGVGSKILLFTTVSSDIAQANMKAMSESRSSNNRPMLTKASSMMVQHFSPEEIRWMKLRSVELNSADGLPPLPMQISWVRDGILVVGMDNEMHVYCQWRGAKRATSEVTPDGEVKKAKSDFESSIYSRNLTDADIITLKQDTSGPKRLPILKMIPHSTSTNVISGADPKKKGISENQPLIESFMPDYGLFEASRMACPVLPQYHPKQLMELLNFGKIRRVKAILMHLVRCLSGAEHRAAISRPEVADGTRQRAWSRSRTLSISIPQGTSPSESQNQSAILSEEFHLDYIEVNSIPPLPLHTLLAADKETVVQHTKEDGLKNYSGLFSSDGLIEEDDDLDNILMEDEFSTNNRERRRSMSAEKQGLTNFGNRHGRMLTRLLTHTHLPGLSSLDQMHLLALADTVASCNTAFADKFQLEVAKTETTPASDGTFNSSPESLDDCGLRFLLAMRHHSYLLRCLPPQQRVLLHKQGLDTATVVWAFYSESEEELLNVIPGMQRGNPRWSELKELGAGWWIRNNAVLKRTIEKVAKAAFQANNDPLDAAIYYLAMKKKNLIWGLFRSVKDQKMTEFFQNNFSENRWRKAALKNAFVLLGKQRFIHAAAFFLLANSLRDAIEVCLNKLNDFQLAMIIVRLYEGELEVLPHSLQRLLYEEILGCDKDGNNYDQSKANPDPFLRSMACWILKDCSNALNTLLQTDIGSNYSRAPSDENLFDDTVSRNVFNFYVYLRTHPLLIRQQIADTAQGSQNVLLTSFSHSSDKKMNLRDRQVLFEYAITPMERRLYFMTAHTYFKAGCPALALEVLTKLPTKVIDTPSNSPLRSPAKNLTPSGLRSIDTGIIKEEHWSTSIDTEMGGIPKVKEGGDVFDWGEPVMNSLEDEPLDLKLSDDDEEDELDIEGNKLIKSVDSKDVFKFNGTETPDIGGGGIAKMDIMAQQLKFVACLKIMMEELSTLATGYEVDGGQLRYQLYVWLEREVEALKELCNYGGNYSSDSQIKMDVSVSGMDELEKSRSTPDKRPGENPTLHEILLADKLDFEAKLHRAEKRKHWLKANETLLRTLLSYCSLHGASGGGLASVRMELILLLQELQQEKTQHQLLSPLPFPTTLPLLSASVACHKTVVTDPIRHLQAMSHDILSTMINLPSPAIPSFVSYAEVFVLRDLSIALSACIYQSLCDSESFCVKQNGYLSAGMEALASTSVVYQDSHLVGGFNRRRRFSSNEEPMQPTTAPNKWPGVTSLRALIERDKDEDSPKLTTLLTEAFIAIYMSLLVHALVACESHTLYRLVGQNFSEQTWSLLYGGGMKKLLKVAVPSTSATLHNQSSTEKQTQPGEASIINTLVRHRENLNWKIFRQFGSQPAVIKEDRPTYREQFVPPETSVVNYLMSKPLLPPEYEAIDYDSNESLPSEDEEDDDVGDDDDYLNLKDTKISSSAEFNEHSDPNSYSWGIIRYAVVRLAQHQLQKFLSVAGLELQELPSTSPLIHSIMKLLDLWLNILKEKMDAAGAPPNDYIPSCYVETSHGGPAIQKYRSILEPANTPFKSKQKSAYQVRRLWSYLVRQEHVQDIFIRYIFGRKKIPQIRDEHCSDDTEVDASLPDPIRIIHKDQDSISSFCINKAGIGILALATTKEIQELDISVLLEPPLWLEDDCEYDILNLNTGPESLPATEYLVVQTAADRPLLAQLAPSGHSASTSNLSSPASIPSTFTVQTGRGTTVLMKHKIEGVRRMSSHPILPVYLTGCQDGSVRIWEWGHGQPVATPRTAGAYAKVTRVLFNPQGNKFGIADGDGKLSLWQVGLSSNANKMFFTHNCHSKITSDFVFVGSSSLTATAGHSSENKNVCLWDTLLPQKRALVKAFTCHDQGCSCLVYAPQHQMIISGGKKGEIFILDVRQRQVRHNFTGHDSAVKCIALDPNEEFFVTGSADGDIKVWGLSYRNTFFTFPGEHVRNTFFRNIGDGVSQLYVDTASRLFSCGADGSMKLRQLPQREKQLDKMSTVFIRVSSQILLSGTDDSRRNSEHPDILMSEFVEVSITIYFCKYQLVSSIIQILKKRENNFSENRWRKAALKNAFVLLGSNDLFYLLIHYATPLKYKFYFYFLKDCSNALNTLLQTDIGSNYSRAPSDENLFDDTVSRNVFNFYVYLRTHPLLIRKQIADTAQGSQNVLLISFSHSSDKKMNLRDRQVLFEYAITPMERRLYFMTAHTYFKAGCPALALEVLSKLPTKVIDTPSNILIRGLLRRSIEMGGIPKVKEGGDVFDWGEPVMNSLQDESLDLKLSDDDEEDELDIEGNKLIKSVNSKDVFKFNGNETPDVGGGGIAKTDIMAQQLKFVACLKIMMEELSALATGYEVDGGQLRYQLYVWLEREKWMFPCREWTNWKNRWAHWINAPAKTRDHISR
uniref:RAVE complex protein Rav1 C-terminal domain-containing protein n=1 Tax=Strigamia maritima TaxID=126957 RepID=T1IMB2_STRMM